MYENEIIAKVEFFRILLFDNHFILDEENSFFFFATYY